MSLVGLPSELLRQVVAESMWTPQSFESLLLTCRTVYECGKSLIELHNSLNRDWKSLEWTNWEHALPLLQSFIEEPLRAAYIQTVDFKGDDRPMLSVRPAKYKQTPQYKATEELIQDPGFTDRIVNFMSWIPYFGDVDMDFLAWINDIKGNHETCGSDDPPMSIYILLLTLLRNVKTVTLPFGWDEAMMKPSEYPNEWAEKGPRQMYELLDLIRKQHNAGASEVPLSELERLEAFAPQDYDSHVMVDNLALFLAMPKLREAYVTSIKFADYVYMDPEFRLYPLSPVLSKLELSHCCIDAFGIGRLVAQMPSLTSFKYEHACKHHGTLFAWDAGEFMAVLGEKAGDRLEEVAITLENSKLAAISRGVTSMGAFTRLKSLEVDMRVFLGPALESGENLDHGTKPKEGYEEWTPNAVPSLTKILPPSLENFNMFVWAASHLHPSKSEEFSTIPLGRLYKDFGENRASNLPHLASCKLRSTGDRPQTSSTEPTVWDCIESQGVECEFRAKMPWWQAKFTKTFGALGRRGR